MIAAGVVVGIALLFWPIYIEPGEAGSISCGRLWDPARMESILEGACESAIEQRREAVLVAPLLVVAGSAVVVVGRRRASDTP
jgi:hypothetical protein